jgi:hypothetical protein
MFRETISASRFSQDLIVALRGIMRAKFARSVNDAEADNILTKLAQFVWAKYLQGDKYGE